MSTQTRTSTRTVTYARHIASKVAADLKRLQRLYGVSSPDDSEIDAYQTEISMLLEKGYLGEVTYGFKRNGNWVYALKYRAVGNELTGAGDDPGGIRPTEDISGAHFTSFLAYSYAWRFLSDDDKREFQASLPVRRIDGNEPGLENGHWTTGDRRYVSGPLGVQRSMIKRY